jgi:hypothetical protein
MYILRRIKEMAKNAWGNYTQSDVVSVGPYQVFVSYYTPIAIVHHDYILVVDQKFSSTTSKQTTQWLRHMGNDHFGRNYKYNIAYVSPQKFKDALKDIGWTSSTGWIR